jgi:hypothetical protein
MSRNMSIIFVEEGKLLVSSICNFIELPITSSVVGINILFISVEIPESVFFTWNGKKDFTFRVNYTNKGKI